MVRGQIDKRIGSIRRMVGWGDRCGSIILSGHSIIRLEAGELATRQDSPIDLCETCTDRLGDWLKSGRQTSQNGLGTLPAGFGCAIGRLVGLNRPVEVRIEDAARVDRLFK